MPADSETVRGILELPREELNRHLRGLSDGERTQLLIAAAEHLNRANALVDISTRVSDTLSLDLVFSRLIEIVTEALGAERSSLFLHDPDTDELFSRVMQGSAVQEVRFPAGLGIAGAAFSSGQASIIPDAYADPRFNRDVDTTTGFRTRNILCVPVRNSKGSVIGVTQALNKREGEFTAADRHLLESLSTHAAAALENARLFEEAERAHREEALLLDVVSLIASEIHLDPLLAKIVLAATHLLGADRGSLFLHDPATNELYSRIAGGLSQDPIRFPATAGIAGECFTTGDTVSIDDAYSDARFNQAVDKGTGYRTRNILCMVIASKGGKKVGVMEILNKKSGPFTTGDQRRLAALCAQAAVSIENAQLFEDISDAHSYSENILRSMSNSVITLDAGGVVSKVNDATRRIVGQRAHDMVGRPISDIFSGPNRWVVASLEKMTGTGKPDIVLDADLRLEHEGVVSVNLTAVPLKNSRDKRIGSMLVMEDITREKRLRSTMSRYMSKAVMDRLLDSGDAVLGGTSREVSVLFSDIRGFSTLSERLGPRETVAMLNEYFTEMVDVVFAHHGILDKYIGDMIMAVFGSVLTTEKDADNAVTVGSQMMIALRELNARRARANGEPIRIGVGVSTGQVVAGNIGSPKRFDYTVIGDRVNLAERLESANKFYGTEMLICQPTASRLKRSTRMRELDLIRVRGIQNPVSIYEVLEHHTRDTFPQIDDVLDRFDWGLTHYRRRDWVKAATAFREALAANPEDRPSRIFLERCEIYDDNPPPEDWNGVWSLQHQY